MDIPEYTFKEVGYSGSLQDIANILEYPQEQVLFSGLETEGSVTRLLVLYLLSSVQKATVRDILSAKTEIASESRSKILPSKMWRK